MNYSAVIFFLLTLFISTPPSAVQLANQQQKKEDISEVQKKIDSQLLIAIKRAEGKEPVAAQNLEIGIPIDDDGKVAVDIKADVSKQLLKQIEKLDGTVTFSSVKFKSISAQIPLKNVVALAESAAVKFIYPADRPRTDPPKPKP